MATRQEIIEDLQNRIGKNRIADIDGLKAEIKKTGLDVDAYEDVLHPMEYNTCDRCGDIEDSEVGFFWIDGFDWEDGNPKDEAILAGINAENEDYCAICYHCLDKLEEKGRDILNNNDNHEPAYSGLRKE